MTPAEQSQRDAIVTLLGSIEAEHRDVDIDHLDIWQADVLILDLLTEYLKEAITKNLAELANAIAAAGDAYTTYVRAALNQGANE